MATFDYFMAEHHLGPNDAPLGLAAYIYDLDPTWPGEYEEEPLNPISEETEPRGSRRDR